jgi:hypothetical protein
MIYDYSRWDRLSDDEVWALNVRQSYNEQLEEGVDEPLFTEVDRLAMPGGDCLEELGKLGLNLAVYFDGQVHEGTFIEPDSKYPRYPEKLRRYEDEAA